MFDEIKRTWRQLRRSGPGHRFQDYHRVHQEKRRGAGARFLSVAIGVVIVAIGIVALPAPGPGTLVIAVGAAFIARESLAVARFMDWLELRLRSAIQWLVRSWRRATTAERVVACIVCVTLLGGATLLVWRLAFRA
jgi:uncharacterized protein (TIGR02611 family)